MGLPQAQYSLGFLTLCPRSLWTSEGWGWGGLRVCPGPGSEVLSRLQAHPQLLPRFIPHPLTSAGPPAAQVPRVQHKGPLISPSWHTAGAVCLGVGFSGPSSTTQLLPTLEAPNGSSPGP